MYSMKQHWFSIVDFVQQRKFHSSVLPALLMIPNAFEELGHQCILNAEVSHHQSGKRKNLGPSSCGAGLSQ